jgi:hypothetical protein
LTQAASGADGISSEVMAAIMAAVQSFLDEESLSLAATDGRLSSWRLAARGAAQTVTFGASGSWRGVG